jgi:hypothetical protein
MAKLVLSLNGVIQGEFPLYKERITIGRKPEADIRIDNLAVSGGHSLIITILDDSFVEDLGSTNGTYVNGKLVKKHALQDGDVISIGKHELKYINENAKKIDDEFEKTVVIRPENATAAIQAAQAVARAEAGGGSMGSTASRPVVQPMATESAARRSLEQAIAPGAPTPALPLAKLKVLNGPIAGRELELTRAMLTLGRPGVQVAVISRRPAGYFLTHIESDGVNYKYPVVNGQQIGAQAYTLKSYDVIELAGIKMEFMLMG